MTGTIQIEVSFMSTWIASELCSGSLIWEPCIWDGTCSFGFGVGMLRGRNTSKAVCQLESSLTFPCKILQSKAVLHAYILKPFTFQGFAYVASGKYGI